MFKHARVFFWILLVLSLLTTGSPLAAQDIRLGVLAKRGVAKAQQKWGPTADYLSKKLSSKCVLIPLKFVEIEPALKNGDIDFLLANSAFFAKFEEKYRLKAITTMINRKQNAALDKFGGVLFSLKDSPVNDVGDIRGKTVYVRQIFILWRGSDGLAPADRSGHRSEAGLRFVYRRWNARQRRYGSQSAQSRCGYGAFGHPSSGWPPKAKSR